MAKSRKNTAQPFAKGMGARTISSALSAAQKGAGATANPQDPNRELTKNAGGGFANIRQASRARTAGKLADMLKAKAGAVPLAGPPKGLPGKPANVPAKGQEPTGPLQQLSSSKPANVSSTRTGSTKPKGPVQKTYVSKGEINQTGNERAGQDFATFTVDGKPGEYHEYVDPKTGKKKTVYVPPKKKAGPAKGLAAALKS